MDTPTPVPWYTPTPIPINEATPAFTLGIEGYEVAEHIVQGYQFANQRNTFDVIMTMMLVFLVIGGLWSITRHLKRL